MKKPFAIYSLLCLLLLAGTQTKAQEVEDFDYRNEIVWGLGKNTNSRLLGSGFVRYSLRAKERVYQTFTLEIAFANNESSTTSQGRLKLLGVLYISNL
ncbi:MAG: hypothetical protein AAFQ98_26445, partial [Bacteroidota bacterium]